MQSDVAAAVVARVLEQETETLARLTRYLTIPAMALSGFLAILVLLAVARVPAADGGAAPEADAA